MPEQMVVVLDRSGSMTASELAQNRQLLIDVVDGLTYGDQLTILVAHARGRRIGTAPVVVEMPSARNAERPLAREELALKAARQAGRQSVQRAFDGKSVASTDLFASIHTALDMFHNDTLRTRSLVLMSDMLQCTPDMCIERPGSVPDSGWIAKQVNAGTVPALDSICVSAVGPDPSTPHGVQVREFWTAYISAAGAKFSADRYRHSMPDPSVLRCT